MTITPWTKVWILELGLCKFVVILQPFTKSAMFFHSPYETVKWIMNDVLIPTTRVVHERNVAVAEGCQMIVLTQTPNLPCFSVGFYQLNNQFQCCSLAQAPLFQHNVQHLWSVLSRLTTWMVNFWHSWRKGDTTPFWCCFLIPSLHRTGANQFPWWTTLKDLKHCTSARVYQYLAGRGRKQVMNKSYLHIMESVTPGGMTNHCMLFFVSNHSMELVKPISFRLFGWI